MGDPLPLEHFRTQAEDMVMVEIKKEMRGII